MAAQPFPPTDPRTHQGNNRGGGTPRTGIDLPQLREEIANNVVREVRGEFDVVRRELANILAAVGHTQHNAEASAEITRVADGINQLQSERGDTARLIDTLASELSYLKGAINEIPERVDSFGHGANGSLAATINAHLAQLRQAVEQMPSTPAFDFLEQQLGAITQSIEYLTHGDEGYLPTRFHVLDERLDEITRAVAALSTNPQGGQDHLAGLERVEARVVSLAKQIEVDSGHTLPADLGQQLAGVSQLLQDMPEQLRSLPAFDPGGQLQVLHQQLQAIAGQLETVNAPEINFQPIEARLGSIEQQMAASRDVTIDIAARAAEQALDAVELKAAGIDRDDLEQLSADLKTLKELAREDTGAQQEIFRAVHDTLRSIVDRLSGIEDRLAPAIAGAGWTPPPNQPQPSAEAGLEAVQQSTDFNAVDDGIDLILADNVGLETTSSFAEPRQVPNIAMDDGDLAAFEAETEAPAENDDDIPLEPGSGTPDLAALVKRANERRSKRETEPRKSGSADLVAEARRAAARRAAEAIKNQPDGTVASDDNSAGKSGRPGATKGSLAGLRKTLIASALVAALLAIGYMVVMPMLRANNDADIVRAPVAPAAETIVDDETDALIGKTDSTAGSSMPADAGTPGDGQVMKNPVRQVGDTPPVIEIPADVGDDATAMVGQDRETGPAAPANSASDAATMDQSAAQEDKSTAIATMGEDMASGLPEGIANASLSAAVAEGNPLAQFEIGRRFMDGEGVSVDMKQAAKWYERAAEKGLAVAQYRLGNFHEKGRGVDRDIDAAATWYRRAADQGNALAMHNLAVLYASGLPGSDPDMSGAAEWFRKAAELGVKDSQVNLGILYSQGVGLPNDLHAAYKWFAVAAAAGDREAEAKRDTVANVMGAEQLDAAKAAVADWKPAKVVYGANAVNLPEAWQAGKANPATNQDARQLNQPQDISKVQDLLTQLGFDPGPVDGMIGAKTRRAILDFARSQNLPLSDKIDTALLDALVLAAG